MNSDMHRNGSAKRRFSPFQSKLGTFSTGLSLDPAESLLLKKEAKFRRSFDCPEARESFRLAAFQPPPPMERYSEEGEADLAAGFQSLNFPQASWQEGATSVCPSPRMCRTDRPLTAAMRSSSGPLEGNLTHRLGLDEVPSRSFSAPNVMSVKVSDAWGGVPDTALANPFATAGPWPIKTPHPSLGPVDGSNPFAEASRTPFAQPFGRLNAPTRFPKSI